MWLRANVVLAVAVVFAIVQMFASATGGPRTGDLGAAHGQPSPSLAQSVAAQEDDDDNDDDEDNDDDDDNDDDEDNNDDEDEDNNDDDEDNDDDKDNNDGCDDSDNDDGDDNVDDCDDDDDSDNDDDGSDNEDDDEDADEDAENEEAVDIEADNEEADTADVADSGFPIGPPSTNASASPSSARETASALPSPSPSPAPVTEVQVVTTGTDTRLALPGNRVVVQIFASTPAGLMLNLRLVDPLAYPPTPGIRAGHLIFVIQAFDATGMEISTLPADVSVMVRYSDADIVGLDETYLTLSRLDPLDQTWKTASNLLVDPLTNTVMFSVLDTGVFAAYVP
jgi:hypothetical protein